MNRPSQRYSQDLRRYYRLPAVQVSLTLVLSLFVIATFIIFALRPTIVSIVTLRKTIEESKVIQQKLETKVANLQKAAAQLDAVKEMLPIVNTDIPNKGAEYSPLTLAVENLAFQTGTLLESESLGSTLLFSRVLTPFEPSKKQSIVPLSFSVRVTGSYPGVSSFLKGLLSMERIIMVDSVALTKDAGAKTELPSVSLNISGNTFYLADEAQLNKSMPTTKGGK